MALVVQKFGGSSVANTERIQNVARIVTDTFAAGNDVVVVVSAQGDTTDDLMEKALAQNSRPSKRELDVLLSAGEQISISLLAMAIDRLGFPVVSLTGWQAGFFTTRAHSNARIHRVDTERIHSEIEKRKIVVVAGFQGINKNDDITTLGRGGSDTSAVAIACAMHADVCQIYTDVEGVYTADPRKVANAVKLSEISFDEMLELSSLGAQVLHNRSVEMAKKYNMKLEVLSSLTNVPGTLVKEVANVEKMLIKGVTKDDDIIRVTLKDLDDRPGLVFKIFAALAKKNVDVDIIVQTAARGTNLIDVSFTIHQKDLEITEEVMEEVVPILGPSVRIVYKKDISKVSIVGAGMQSNPGIAAKMFGTLSDHNINILTISTSEIKISVLVDQTDADKAVSAIHEAFII